MACRRAGARLAAMGFFALVAVGEMHHLIKTIVHASCDIGMATSIPFVIFGLLKRGNHCLKYWMENFYLQRI
jgi:hypothetical protein